jgi:protein SCO1
VKSSLYLRIGAIFLGLLVIGVLWFNIARPIVVLPRIRLAPGYGLHDPTGKLVTSEDQRGKLTLYSFAPSRCGKECQSMYSTLHTVDEELAKRSPVNPPLNFITITVDPEYDTPDHLTQTPLPFEPQRVNWTWLTGSQEKIKLVNGAGFNVLYQPQPDGSVYFAPKMVLVDGFGTIRDEFDSTDMDSSRILKKLDLLWKEIEHAQGPDRLAYEAAHFFACYP